MAAQIPADADDHIALRFPGNTADSGERLDGVALSPAGGRPGPALRGYAVAHGQSFAFTTAIRHHLKLDTAQLAALLDSLELRANGRGSPVHEIESEPGATGESYTSGRLWSPQSKPAAEMTMEVCPAL